MDAKITLAAVAALILLAGTAAAHEDRFPTVEISAPRAVDASALVKAVAMDEDFRAGVSYMELYEDGKLVERKDCALRLRCEIERRFEHSEESVHSYKALASDATGHRKYAAASVRFRGSDLPPAIGVVAKAGVDEGSQLSIDVSASDPNNDIVTLTVRNMPRGSRMENGQFLWAPGFDQSGAYVLIFEANTATKKTTKSVRIDVRDRNREFELRGSTPADKNTINIDEGESKRFFVNAFDPDGDALSFRWVLDGRVVSYSPAYTYRPGFRDAGTHTLEVVVKEGSFFLAREGSATKSRSWTIEVKDLNRKPSMSEQRKYIVEEGQRVSFAMRFDDPDNDPLHVEAFDLPEGSEFNPQTGVFRWQTEVGDHGKYQPRFRVTDSKGSAMSRGVQIEIRKKPTHEIVHEDLHRVGRLPAFTDSDRDAIFGYGSYGLIG